MNVFRILLRRHIGWPVIGQVLTRVALVRATLAVIVVVGSNSRAGESEEPVTLRFLKTGEFNNKGHISYGTVFRTTNHTTNRFDVWLSAIENRVGTNWVVQSRPMERLTFREGGKVLEQIYLAPHAAEYATVQLAAAPTGTTWRVRALVRPVLTGLPETLARIKGYPGRMLSRMRTGETNIPVNPLATNITFFGKGTEVLSQEVSDE